MKVPETPEEFETEARRFLRQAQAKAAQIVIFPELTGLMLAPYLVSRFKLGFIKRQAQGQRRGAGFWSRRVGRVAGSTAGALGGGFRGSLIRLLSKNSDALKEIYVETFGKLAQEFATAIVGGSLYLHDPETATVRHRAYLFNADGEVLGYQEKLNLSPDEQDLASPGSDLAVFETRFGRVGLLIGRDAMYPELARLQAMQGADLLVGIMASPGAAQAKAIRSALAVRAEENQAFVAVSFMLGPNLLGQENKENYFGQSALLAPISLTLKGDGVLTETGTDRTEGIIAATLDGEALDTLRETSGFRPRQQMHLGNAGPILAEVYREGLTIEQAIEQRIAGPAELEPEPVEISLGPPAESFEEVSEEEAPPLPSVPESLSLTSDQESEEL
jgi:predicted amidohydrolase